MNLYVNGHVLMMKWLEHTNFVHVLTNLPSKGQFSWSQTWGQTHL